MSLLDTPVTRQLGIEVPLICGPMYPCSNPELVAAASEAGGMGVVQPLSLTFVHGHEFRAGLRFIRSLTRKPIGLNVIVEQSSKTYLERMRRFVDEAIEEGVRFFLTSLGNPRWVVDRAHSVGGVVYHDATERKWAQKGVDSGVDGLIGVNRRAGGHAGPRGIEELYAELAVFGVPLVCAGGIGDEQGFVHALQVGYGAVQMGTRFIATLECTAPDAYKQAILKAGEEDIVLTERLTGVPVAVIRTPYVDRIGTKAGPIGRFMLRGRKTKHWMRMIYSLRAFRKLKQGVRNYSPTDYLQAGKSVSSIASIEPTAAIVHRFRDAAARAPAGQSGIA